MSSGAMQAYGSLIPSTTTNTLSAGQTYQPIRLCVNTSLGNFYLLVNPKENIDALKVIAQEKVWEIYETLITVNRVQDEKRIDLCPSYRIGSLLQDGSVVILNYTVTPSQPDSPSDNRNQMNYSPTDSSDDDCRFQSFLSSFDLSTITPTYATHQPSPQQNSTPILHHNRSPPQGPSPQRQIQTTQQRQTMANALPAPVPIMPQTNVAHTIHNAPHTKITNSPSVYPYSPVVLKQNLNIKVQQQSSTILVKQNSPASVMQEESVNESKSASLISWSEAPPQKVLQNKEFSFSVSVSNAVTAAYLYPTIDTSKSQIDNSPNSTTTTETEMPFEVSVEEEGKEAALTANKYNLRVKKHDHEQYGEKFTVFMRIRKNSHYGQTRFIIKVRVKDVDATPSGMQCVSSGPIVVLSKIRKRKRKPEESTLKKSKESVQIQSDSGSVAQDVSPPDTMYADMGQLPNAAAKRRKIMNNNEAGAFGLLNEFNC